MTFLEWSRSLEHNQKSITEGMSGLLGNFKFMDHIEGPVDHVTMIQTISKFMKFMVTTANQVNEMERIIMSYARNNLMDKSQKNEGPVQ